MFADWQGAALTGRFSLAVVPTEAILFGLAIAAVFLVGAVVIVWVDRWRRRRNMPEKPDVDLETFNALCEKGHLSREELERIRAGLASRHAPEPPQTDS